MGAAVVCLARAVMLAYSNQTKIKYRSLNFHADAVAKSSIASAIDNAKAVDSNTKPSVSE